MIYYGEKKIANSDVSVHGDTITIENNAKLKTVEFINQLPTDGDDVLYAVKEDNNIYYWNINHSTDVVTKSLRVADRVGTMLVYLPDGTTGYIKRVNRDIGKDRTNISLIPAFTYDYDPDTGIISIILVSQVPDARVSTIITYEMTISVGGWTIFGPVGLGVETEGGIVSIDRISNSDILEIMSK